MTQIRKQILDNIFICIEEINNTLPQDQRLEASEDAYLVSENGVFDSLSIINFFVSLEELFKNQNIDIQLLDENFIVDPEGPYNRVSSLADFILDIIDK